MASNENEAQSDKCMDGRPRGKKASSGGSTQQVGRGTPSESVVVPSCPEFRAFNPHGELRIYYRNLPHWRQPGATYFVTFRQRDSIPKAIVAHWQDVRERWLMAHGIPWEWKRSTPARFARAYCGIPREQRRAFERQQSKMLHEELNRCHGSCVLRESAPRHIVAESLEYFHGTRWWLGDYVIMPNHSHLLVQPFDGWELEELIGSIKRWSARHIRAGVKGASSADASGASILNEKGFWQFESYDRIVRDLNELMAFRRYIAFDPRKSQLSAGQFTHHQANWLGPLDFED